MKHWRIPAMWAGQTVAILASGPSMSADVAEQVREAGIPAIAINTTWRLAPWAAMLYAADVEWWHRNPDAHGFKGLKVTIQERPNVPDILVLRNAGAGGYTDLNDCVHTLGHSSAQAIQIAVKAGASRVLLAGMDMTNARGRHWHEDHPQGMKLTEEAHFARWRERLAAVAPEFERRGVDVVAVTPTALTCFRLSTLEEELCHQP